MTEQEDLREGGGESATKPQVTTYPSPQRIKMGESLIVIRESPFDKCLRESLSEVDKGLWETPNQTTDSDQDKASRLN